MRAIFDSVTGRISFAFAGLVLILVFVAILVSSIYSANVVHDSYENTLDMFFENRAEDLNDTLRRVDLASELLLNSNSDFLKMMTTQETDILDRIHKYCDIKKIFETNMKMTLENITKDYRASLFINPDMSVYDVCPQTRIDDFKDFRNGIYSIQAISHMEMYSQVANSNGDTFWIGNDGKMIYAVRRFVAYSVVGGVAKLLDIGILCLAIDVTYLDERLSENSMTKSAEIQLLDMSRNTVVLNTVSQQYNLAECVKYDYELASNLQMTVLVPEADINQYFRNYILILTFISLIFILVGIIVVIMISKTITKPIVALSQHMNRMKNIEKIQYNYRRKDEISNIYFNYNAMVDKINKVFAELEEASYNQKKMEIRLLQEQINPHFIYNALDNVNCRLLMMGEFDVANKISNLADYIRYNTKNPQDMTTIEKEVQMLRSYMGVFWLQYGDRIELTEDIAEETKEIKIPKMLIQPLLENAVMHGIEYVGNDEQLKINFKAFADDKNLTVMVADSGCCKDVERINRHIRGEINISQKRGYGIRNVNERIHMRYGNGYGYGLCYTTNAHGETVAKFVIPRASEEEEMDDSEQNT